MIFLIFFIYLIYLICFIYFIYLISFIYWQARNIKQLMVWSRLKALPHSDCSDLQPAGCFKHQLGNRGRKCELCPRIKEGDTFMSSYTWKRYNIRHNLTCKFKYCVYLIKCKRCHKQYVGKSVNHMHTRYGGYRYEIDIETSELGVHFSECGLE